MELTWWGTASFRIKAGRCIFFLDPYVSRNEYASPRQYLDASSIKEGELVFLSHGHFDHLMDVPQIIRNTGASVYCSREAGSTLLEHGIPSGKIYEVEVDGFKVDFYGNLAEAFFSEHVVFDRQLLLKTLLRSHIRIPRLIRLSKYYPKGQVLSWRFHIENKIVHFFGSGGSPPSEMEKLSSNHTDILLVPLQGHTDICNIALEYVHVMRPKIVIPHHFDDFYPPMSTTVDITPFIEGVKRECPATEVRVLELNETIVL